jgi:hypothetical protein
VAEVRCVAGASTRADIANRDLVERLLLEELQQRAAQRLERAFDARIS